MNCAKGLLEASGQLCGGHELLLMKCNQQPGIGRRPWAMDLWIFVHHIYRLLSAHHHSSTFPKGFPYMFPLVDRLNHDCLIHLAAECPRKLPLAGSLRPRGHKASWSGQVSNKTIFGILETPPQQINQSLSDPSNSNEGFHPGTFWANLHHNLYQQQTYHPPGHGMTAWRVMSFWSKEALKSEAANSSWKGKHPKPLTLGMGKWQRRGCAFLWYMIVTIWLFNRHSHGKSPCLIGKPSINGPFSMAMLNNQRVIVHICEYINIAMESARSGDAKGI